jgi:hypothetical protein
MSDPDVTGEVFLSDSSKRNAVVRAVAERCWKPARHNSNFGVRISHFGLPDPLRLDETLIEGSSAQFLRPRSSGTIRSWQKLRGIGASRHPGLQGTAKSGTMRTVL